jgi:hypothetical protein
VSEVVAKVGHRGKGRTTTASPLASRQLPVWGHAALPLALELEGVPVIGFSGSASPLQRMLASLPPGGVVILPSSSSPPGATQALARQLSGDPSRPFLLMVSEAQFSELAPLRARGGWGSVSAVQAVDLAEFSRTTDERPGPPESEVSSVAVRLPSTDPDPEVLSRALRKGARLFLAPGSILEAAALERLVLRLRRSSAVLWVTDPFAGGRLDGGFLEGSRASPSSGRPPNPEKLQAWFAPVLRLGFLPRRGSRTLAQASLQYLLVIRGVAGVFLPVARPELLRQANALPGSPRLTLAERAQIRKLSEGDGGTLPPLGAGSGAAGEI